MKSLNVRFKNLYIYKYVPVNPIECPGLVSKLQELLSTIKGKIEAPINGDNKKILIFTAFSDTAEYLYDQVSKYMKINYGMDTAVITGSIDGRTTVKGLKATLNNVLTYFSPIN